MISVGAPASDKTELPGCSIPRADDKFCITSVGAMISVGAVSVSSLCGCGWDGMDCGCGCRGCGEVLGKSPLDRALRAILEDNIFRALLFLMKLLDVVEALLNGLFSRAEKSP